VYTEQFANMGDTPTRQGQETFSRFEQMMINQLHAMESDHKSHHQYCEILFQFIENQVEDIQSRIGTMFFGPDN